jgi:mannose-6-phosphate isomerase-like protein (cupin superfamily)
MNFKEYISGGIIEEYCLGLLNEEESRSVEQYALVYPEVKHEIESFMQALERYALDYSVATPEHLKNNTAKLINNLICEEEANIKELPLLNKFSDSKNWLKAVEPVLPRKLTEEMFVHELRNDEVVSQVLIWTAVNYPDEVHEDVQESFIVLKGRCRCYIEETIVEMGPGEFLEIPMYTHHTVEVLESPVLAVVQRIKVALDKPFSANKTC